MNKKFFTLLVMLLTMSYGAFAQVTDIAADSRYSSSKTYLLKTSGGQYLAADISTDVARLTLINAPLPQTLADLRLASWYIEVSKPEGSIAPIYVFKNAYTDVILALDTEKAVEDLTDLTSTANVIGGSINSWLSTNLATTVGANKFYVTTGDPDKVIVLAADGNFVFPKIIDPADIDTDGNVLEITPRFADGKLTLSPNDLNTQLGASGIYNNGAMSATMDNFFKLYVAPKTTELENPLEHQLQARAVERWEIKYGTDPNDVLQSQTAQELKDAETPLTYISMYPKGTVKDKDKKQTNIVSAVNNTDAIWYTLYSRETGKYVVVDTVYIDGTGQVTNRRIAFGTDNLYNSKNETRYRHPSSYLFRFYYDAKTGSVEIQNKEYVNQIEVSSTSSDTYYKGWVKNSTDLSTYYGLGNPNNGYTIAPLKAGATWLNQTTGTYESGKGTDAAPVNVAVQTSHAGRYLTYAKLLNTIIYTLSDFADIEADIVVKLALTAEYTPFTLTTGVYLFQVKAINRVGDPNRVGKYWKMSLDGTPEFIARARRQDFAHMPAAHWVVQSSANTSTTVNREFNRDFTPAIGINDYVPYRGITYRVKDANGNVVPNQFFFFGGDTIEYTRLDASDEKVGYMNINKEDYDLRVFEFKYLHDLAMDKPLNTVSNSDSAIWVDKEGNATTFKLEEVVEDTYGFDGNISSIKQLKRKAYKMKVAQSNNFDFVNRYVSYNKVNKKYYLTTDKQKASNFFFKENNHDDENSGHYYTLVEANAIPSVLKVDWVQDNTASPVTTLGFSGNGITVIGDDDSYKEELTANGFERTAYFYATKHSDWINESGQKVDKWRPKSIADITSDPFASGANNPDFKEFLETNNLSFAEFQALLGSQIYYMNFTNAATSPNDLNGNYLVWVGWNEAYARSKASVDNNELSLVNGVLADNTGAEVANSAFAIVDDDRKLYRTIGDAEGEDYAKSILKFFRVNSTEKEYLYEDANSKYSVLPLGPNNPAAPANNLNFLGVEGKGDLKNSAMIVRYTSGTVMPQYLISVDETEVPDKGELCTVCEDPNCEHSTFERGYIRGRFLVNLTDSVNFYNGGNEAPIREKFQWDTYTRLAFVDAKLQGDSLIIQNSVYTGNTGQQEFNKPTTWWAKDTINIEPNKHSPVLFQFRLLHDGSTGNDDFLIEAESWKDNKPFNGGIAPQDQGAWVKVQNGVPVIIKTSWNEAYRGAEHFNVETTDDAPVANDVISTSEITVVADYGKVIVKGAAGRKVTIANVLGQTITTGTITSDDAEFTAPAGVVVVSVEGAPVAKALVK